MGKCANWVPQSRSFVGTINAVDLGGGIVTTRDHDFIKDRSTLVSEVMTKEVVTAPEGCSLEEAEARVWEKAVEEKTEPGVVGAVMNVLRESGPLKSEELFDAVKAEAKMLPQVANSVRRDKAEVVCAELRAKLGLSDHEMRKLVLRVPTVLTLNMDKNVNPKLDWLQERLDLSRDELKKICLTLPATLAYSVDKNLEPKLSYFERELGMSPQEIRSKIISMPARLGYSIEKRYRPRLAAIRATAGADPAAVIDRIRAADAEFCKRTGVSIDTLRREQARVR